jgi:hypothetical protein
MIPSYRLLALGQIGEEGQRERCGQEDVPVRGKKTRWAQDLESKRRHRRIMGAYSRGIKGWKVPAATFSLPDPTTLLHFPRYPGGDQGAFGFTDPSRRKRLRRQ